MPEPRIANVIALRVSNVQSSTTATVELTLEGNGFSDTYQLRAVLDDNNKLTQIVALVHAILEGEEEEVNVGQAVETQE